MLSVATAPLGGALALLTWVTRPLPLLAVGDPWAAAGTECAFLGRGRPGGQEGLQAPGPSSACDPELATSCHSPGVSVGAPKQERSVSGGTKEAPPLGCQPYRSSWLP